MPCSRCERYILHNIANCNELLNNIRAERRHPIKLSLAKPSQPDPYWSSMVSIHVFRKRRLRIFKAMKFMQTHRFIRLSLFLTQNYIDKLVRFWNSSNQEQNHVFLVKTSTEMLLECPNRFKVYISRCRTDLR